MGIGEISKDNVNFPKDASISSAGEAQGAALSETSRITSRDTIEQSGVVGETTPKNVSLNPDKPLIDKPQASRVLKAGQEEEAISQNQWLAAGSNMSDFFIISGEMAKMLGEVRFRDAKYAIEERLKVYETSMESATLRKQMKYNEAAQELTKSISSMFQAGVSGLEAVKTTANSATAKQQFDQELQTQKSDLENFKTKLLNPQVDQNGKSIDAKAKEWLGNEWNDNEAGQIGMIPKTNKEKLDELLKNPPGELKNSNEFKEYKTLEAKIKRTEENEVNLVQQYTVHKDNATRSTAATFNSLIQSASQAVVSGLQIEAGNLQFADGELNANLEVMRSYQEGYRKSADQSAETFNELIRNNLSIYEKSIHASYKS